MVESRKPPPPPGDVPKPARVAYYCEAFDKKRGRVCGYFLFKTAAIGVRLDDHACPKCGARRSVYLGGRMTAEQVAEARLRESA